FLFHGSSDSALHRAASTIRRHLVATGDSEGFIKIWKLSDELTTQGSSEIEILDDLAETQAD
ncbi:hypothetical protein AC249_AIPGENE8920, partial [Exaiptasia diaphana]